MILKFNDWEKLSEAQDALEEAKEFTEEVNLNEEEEEDEFEESEEEEEESDDDDDDDDDENED